MSERASLDRQHSERLSVRRRRSRRRALIAGCILCVVLIGAAFYGVWRPAVRVAHVTIFGGDQTLASLATTAMQGSAFGIPRDSIFFVPKERIRSLILAAHPDIAAVSIFRTSFSSISIKIDNRVPLARWCGTTAASTSPADSPLKETIATFSNDCYVFDAGGFLYATATSPQQPMVMDALFSTTTVATSTVSVPIAAAINPVTPFFLFDTIIGSSTTVVGSTLTDANKLPSVFDFARHLSTFGVSVRTIVIRGDEVDFFLNPPNNTANNGARITYLLGDEENAFAALSSAHSDFNLTDGSVSYIDLRFPGKVYVKKVDSANG